MRGCSPSHTPVAGYSTPTIMAVISPTRRNCTCGARVCAVSAEHWRGRRCPVGGLTCESRTVRTRVTVERMSVVVDCTRVYVDRAPRDGFSGVSAGRSAHMCKALVADLSVALGLPVRRGRRVPPGLWLPATSRIRSHGRGVFPTVQPPERYLSDELGAARAQGFVDCTEFRPYWQVRMEG